MKRKIYVISQAEILDTIGGAITIFNNFVNMLANNNFDVTGMCYADSDLQANIAPNVKFVNLMRYYNNKLTYSKALNKYIDEDQPDLLIFFFPSFYLLANLDKKFENIPRILMLHSRPDLYFGNFTDEEIVKFSQLYINTTTQILLPSFYSLLPDCIKNGNVIVNGNPISNIENYCNLNIEHKKIIYLSRIDCWKGLEFLLNSYKIISQKYPSWELHIWGQYEPENYKDKIKALIKKYKLEKNVILMGVCNNPLEKFLEYDFCVFPSFIEGWGLGLSDALSVGLPAIGLKQCSGVNELIVENYNGYLCDENPLDFAGKISLLISDKNLRKQLGENAIKSVKKYSQKTIYNKWIKDINNILEYGYTKDKIEANEYNVQIFPLEKINAMTALSKPKLSIYQKIFSVTIEKKQDGTKHKKFTILGIKINIKVNKQKQEY